jgi:hypothetical protein
LFDFSETLVADYLPVYSERKGQNKTKSTIDDTLGLYTLLDVHKVDMPCYAIVDINRVPKCAVNDNTGVDMSVVTSLSAVVADLQKQMSALVDKVNTINVSSTVPSTSGASTTPMSTTMATVAAVPSKPEVLPAGSWAAKAMEIAADPNAFAIKPPAVVVRRVNKVGMRPASEKVKAVPRYITCFVGRLDKDTTEDDLCDYLAESGITDVKCRKLPDKDGKFRTAAFCVSCLECYRDVFYDEGSWPLGADLRDWVFHPRTNGQA